MEERRVVFKAWQLPLIVAAIAVPIVGATYAGGPPAGLGAAFIAASAIVFLAARAKPSAPIESPGSQAGTLLVIACTAADRPEALAPILDAVGDLDAAAQPRVLVVAPAATGRLASWTSDLAAGRLAAADRLVVTLAGLAASGIDARSSIGDPDPGMAIEDAIRTTPAELVLILSEAGDARASAAAREASRRSPVPLRHVELAAQRPDPALGGERLR
jgi:hypothetical protein